MNWRGEVIQPLDAESVRRAIQKIEDAQIESVVVCLLHSYANPEHEQAIGREIRRALPRVSLTLSCELLPIIKEYERTSTAVINGYVRPVVERYLNSLSDGLQRAGINVPLVVMQSNGGLATAKAAAERPSFCIESGPAAGVMGAQKMAEQLGIRNLMTLDMGGTTAKASIIENGTVLQSKEYEVGAGLNVGHRLLRGAGHILNVPAIDVAEVGAGGGSIARIDDSNSLRVGPHSSGAVPGPACYGRGGKQATVTDANVLLGYLNPQHLLGGGFALDADAARMAIERDVASPLSVSVIEAAYGIHSLANSNMSRALKAVSTERGRDPRRFTLMAFGGSGPVHVGGLAAMLGISRLLIPPYPGVFSAFGLLLSDVAHQSVRTYFKSFEGLDLGAFNSILQQMHEDARQILHGQGYSERRQHLSTQVDIKYEGQGSELTVTVGDNTITPEELQRLGAAFEAEHERTFGHRTNAPRQLVNVRVIARGVSPSGRVPSRIAAAEPGVAGQRMPRRAYFGPKFGWVETPVIGRAKLGATPTAGPLLIEEYDSTSVVPPNWAASIDPRQNIVLEVIQ